MRIHRFYIENIAISPEKVIVTQETNLIHQLKNVFRYKVGQPLNVFNEQMGEIEVEIADIGKKDMSFTYIRQIKDISNMGKSKKSLTLYMSVIKNSNFDLIVEKATELGVSMIIPIVTERTIKNNLNVERLSRIVKEATEQSGRLDLMKMRDTLDFTNAVDRAAASGDLVYYGAIDCDEKIRQKKETAQSVSLFIGPEGGFTENEIKTFVDKGFTPLSLGSHVLRAETAAIVGCGVLSL
jgi:16S rRNA (uracil1498-N3)-methyltransferase